MKFWNYIKKPVAFALFCLPAISYAEFIDFPALDIQNNIAGVTLTNSIFDIDATAFAIVFADQSLIDIPDQAFTLRSTGTIDAGNPSGGAGLFSGSFTVDGGLLSGTFENMFVGHFNGTGAGNFNGMVTFTGGSLLGGSTSGVIEGTFAATGVDAKVGAVVPVPAAVWLFGSGIIGLIAVARRKNT